MRVLTDIDVFGKRVFLRGDLDVSNADVANSKFEIRNSKLSEASVRLQNIKPTVDYLIEHGAKQIVIAGHIGRPEKRRVREIRDIRESEKSEDQRTQNIGEPDFYDEKLSTKNLIEPLEKILGRKIIFSSQLTVNGLQLDSTMNSEQITDNQIFVLENLRFWEGEEKNDPEFAKTLAGFADVYVNDAFGVCHRAHASIVGVPAILPHAAGLHLEQEIIHLTELNKDPKRPFVAIVGGAKIETKVPVIENLAKIANKVLVGGELALQGETLRGYGERVSIASLTADNKDIDQDSIRRFTEIIRNAKTIVWNGPMGVYEQGFDRGTIAIADAIIASEAYSLVGGGETTEFLSNQGLLKRFSFVSSGGGAMLEFLSGKELPGIKALE